MKQKQQIKFKVMEKYNTLTIASLKANLGKQIRWFADGSEDNASYMGVAVLKGVRKVTNACGEFWIYRLDCEVLEGDNLSYAFLNCTESQLEALPEDERFNFSDTDRYISFKVIG